MAGIFIRYSFLFLFGLSLCMGLRTISSTRIALQNKVERCNFPKGFVFGTASASYQYEGAVKEDGRKPSIWDTFSHAIPATIKDHSNGDVATDQYHKYKEDIQLMKDMNMDAYRFSIAWPRIYPDGDGELNLAGVAYYNNLINALLDAGIEPYVTLYHWDLPQALEDSFGGWLSFDIVDKFAAFAEACFRAFGDRVKNWMTFNEPDSIAVKGYSSGEYAPGRCSNCSKGDSATEPYIVAHNIILAHAAAVKIYKQKYQETQRGKIGIALVSYWYEPLTNAPADIAASARSVDFKLGWYLNPLTFGDYPTSMRAQVGDRLPYFTGKQKKDILKSYDFLGLNHYTSRYVKNDPFVPNMITSTDMDWRVQQIVNRDGVAIGPKAASEWLYIVPWGFERLLKFIQERYNPPTIIITENGRDETNNPSLPLEQALNDNYRIDYHKSYMQYMLSAMRDGVNVTAYFAWSLLDNFEWESGYSLRFGLHYVDYNTLKRYPKNSALWFKEILRNSTCASAKSYIQ